MEAAQGLVYEGQRGVWGLEEEWIIVAAKQTIEGSQLRGSQGVDIPWCNMSILP